MLAAKTQCRPDAKNKLAFKLRLRLYINRKIGNKTVRSKIKIKLKRYLFTCKQMGVVIEFLL